MGYERNILCLAKSWKNKGYCVAGKEIVSEGFGAWIRPVSTRPSEEISELEARYVRHGVAAVPHKLSIRLRRPKPHSYQRENHVIDPSQRWSKIGNATWAEVNSAVDQIVGPLWVNGNSSGRGMNDRVPKERAKVLTNSLYLLKPELLRFEVGNDPWVQNKAHIRADFVVAGIRYNLKITDPVVYNEFQGKSGTFEAKSRILCVSLGELFEGYAYKLVASAISPEICG